MEKQENKQWFQVGKLPTGEAVYCDGEGNHAKEVDHCYLAEMTDEEKLEVIP